jgi:hypothetical protein
LPLALDSEKALLCSCIKSNELVDEPALELELFAFPAHRLIFERLRELFEHGSPIDFVILKDFLARSGELEAVGGATYLSDLWDFVPSAANWRHYVAVLAQVRTRRLGILSCSQLLKELVDPATEIGPNLTERFGSIARRLEASLRLSDSTQLEMISQSQSQRYLCPPGSILLGDSHLVKGNVSVLAGPPGVGKSRAALALAEAGACGYSWFNYRPLAIFKTLILQNENGRARIKTEYLALDSRVEELVRISAPPPFGLCFSRTDFRRDLQRAIASFQPDLIIIDPWNAVARDDKARDYLESFDLIRAVIGSGDSSPAILIIAHTRKPLPNERSVGRSQLNLLAGSYVLSSIPRSVFVLQHASDDVNEERVVVTCAKNNDGQLGSRGCFLRSSGQWPVVENFNWNAWDHPELTKPSRSDRANYTPEILSILGQGAQLSKAELVAAFRSLRKDLSVPTAYRMFDKYWFRTLVRYSRKTGRFSLRT